jgi:predicted lipoprotein with Yx(FWY)xxD motif
MGYRGVLAKLLAVAGFAAVFLPTASVQSQNPSPPAPLEDYLREPMPPGFQVVQTELEGPVFADANGKTLYTWPMKALRNGSAGEQKGKPTCDDMRHTENAGLMSPYPAGLLLPDSATRPSCVEVWPPVIADEKAEKTGKWTVVARKDGRKQWAYDEYALYTSNLDQRPGDTIGGTKMRLAGEAGAVRETVGPDPNVPSQFKVYTVATGRLLTTNEGYSVYAWDKDSALKSACEGACLREWLPILAPARAIPQSGWSVIERTPGILQWVFQGRPLYAHIGENRPRSMEGNDIPGWHNVYTQTAPAWPKGWTVQDTRSGQVLADSHGMTIYLYYCNDDAVDQLSCNHPDTPQVYRLAICGRGNPDRCRETFPYVIAGKDAVSVNRAWTIMDIDPKTGRRAVAGMPGGLRVWAYRDRPVYQSSRDHRPGDMEGDSWGEFNGWRNGFKAFWLRDEFQRNAG